jgi:hypothetical protein
VPSQGHSESRAGKQLSDKDDAKRTTKGRGEKCAGIRIREEQFSPGFFMLRTPAEIPSSNRITPPSSEGIDESYSLRNHHRFQRLAITVNGWTGSNTLGYLPSAVLDQLNLYLDDLKAPWRRMILILQECGMRISELLELPIDCLTQDEG